MSRYLADSQPPLQLPSRGRRVAAAHVFDRASIDAVNTALAAERPLLVRGEPGTGKSQLARATAQALGRAFVSKVVDGATEAQDVCWTLDAIARLAKAQLLGALPAAGDQLDSVQDLLQPSRFVAPEALWWAFDWRSAEKQAEQAKDIRVSRPQAPEPWDVSHGCVMLLDEIDKAESTVPNGLLEALGEGQFPVPPGCGVEGDRVSVQGAWPLVIVTTNEERALPDAFLRRCLVLHLQLPKEEQALVEHLVRRAKAHFGAACPEEVRVQAAQLLVEDRRTAQGRGQSPPGQAEYLDLLRAVLELAKVHKTEPGELLQRVRGYALRKHPDEAGA